MKKTKKIVLYLIIFSIVISPAFQIFKMISIGNSSEMSSKDKLLHSSDITNTKQWVTNGNFSSQENWTVTKGQLGDPTDVDASISNGEANYQVLGFEDRFTFEENYNMGASWVKSNHLSFPVDPTSSGIVAGEGFRAGHSWDDTSANQVPSVQWELNFSLPVNMSDYVITSASVSAGLNATVDTNIDTVADGIASNTAKAGGGAVDTYSVGDYIRFYVSISDLQKTKIEEIAYTQSATLGDGNAGSTDNLAQQFMSALSQADLIYYLSSVLETDYRNFTLIVGIRFNCEDNLATDFDNDDFDRAVINSINLTFGYQKKIDQLTSISWNQVGNKPSDISSNPIVIDAAKLNFQYKINETWPISSPNSEFKILINNIQHSETVELSEGITTLKDAKTGGFDVTSLIDKDENINLSLQVYLADQFELDLIINISIDNVYLNITYTEIIEDIETDYDLYLNTLNKTLEPVISTPLGENLTITVKYLDNQTRNHISGATVQLEGKVSGILTEDVNQYSIIINASDLGVGVKTLTVVAQKADYVEQNIPFFVEVTERETQLLLYLNNEPKNDSDTIQVKADEFINVAVNYRDNTTEQFLSGATVSLLGDLTGNLNETIGFYNITLDTDDLDQGITAFTVFVQLEDFKPQSIQFFVELIERETELLLYLNGDQYYDKNRIEVTVDELINVTVNYNDFINKQLLTGATVTLLGINNLTETSSHYNITVDPSIDLDPGINILTVYAQLDNYGSQSIQFFVEIVEKETELLLFLDEDLKNDGDQIQVEVNEFINVTVYYRDNITKQLLSGAIITLIGRGNFNETSSHYNITVNTNVLDQGITILTVFAQKDNYQPQSIQFFVEIVERESELELLFDDDPITLDPVIEVMIGNIINITVYYSDNQTGSPITGALVQLIGEGDTLNFMVGVNQYNIYLNTSNLKIGVSLFTIVAHANNFQIRTIDLRITTNRIKITTSTFSGENSVTGLVGDTIRLRIILNNTNILPSGELIKNATVTYKWDYGQGVFHETDCIYEADLVNVPSGTYTITITSSAGDDYTFETYEITLTVGTVTPPDFSMLFIILAGALVALVGAFTLYEVRFKYPATVRKSRKIRKKIKKGRKTKPIKDLSSREDVIKDHLESNVENIQLEKKTENGIKEK